MRPLRCSVVVQCGGFPQVTQVAQKYAAKLEFVKILRLPENTSNVNIERAGKTKQLYFLWVLLLGALLSSFYCSNINLRFQSIMPGGNCPIYGYSSSRTISGVTLYRSNTGETFLYLLFVVG